MAQASAMLRPSIFADRAVSLSLVPWHSGQTENATARSTKARMCGWSVSLSLDRNDLRTRARRPS